MRRLRNIFSPKGLVTFVFLLLFAGAVAGAWYYYTSYQKLLKNPDIITKQEVEYLQEAVGKLVQLPQDEAPSTATVLDRDKLQDQPFFANAENGDKILIYTKAKKAILYRPSSNRIIEIMPVALDNKENAEAVTQNIKVALYNGTKVDGLTATAETKIKEKIVNVEFPVIEKATMNNYLETVVVDVNGTMADQAKKIAEAVGGGVGALPDGETKPETDILVIVAN